MIKGISFLRPAASSAAFETLASFFKALGFEPGKSWDDQQSRGASFLAPLGNLEFIHGEMPAASDVFVEVTSLDAAHRVAESWLRAHGVDEAARLSAIS